MNRKDGSALINNLWAVNVNGETEDESEASRLLSEDYSNIADFGKSIEVGTTTFDDTFTKTLGNLVDKVGKTDFNTGAFVEMCPDVWKDSTGYTNMLEEVNIEIGDFNSSKYFNILSGSTDSDVPDNSFEAIFGRETPVTSAKYYNTVLSYNNKITIADDQFKNAFRSPSDMDRFFSAIEARKMQKFNWAKSQMAYACFDAMVLDNAKRANRVKKLTTNGTGIDASSIAQFNNIIDELKVYSTKYSGFSTSTEKSELKMAIYAPMYNEFMASLSGVHHPELINIPFENIRPLTYFQYNVEENAQVITGIAPTTTSGKHVDIENIVAVIYHERACGLYNADEKTSAVRIPNEWATNIFHHVGIEMIVREDFPCIIITKNGTSDVTEETAVEHV